MMTNSGNQTDDLAPDGNVRWLVEQFIGFTS
jgi:hypothetical protein